MLATGPVVEVFDPGQRGDDSAGEDVIRTLDESERLHLRRALDAAQGRIHGPGGAAELLGINGSTLRSRMQKLGISKHVS